MILEQLLKSSRKICQDLASCFFINQINSSWIGFVAPIVFFDGVDDIIVKIVNKIQKVHVCHLFYV